MYWFVEGKKNPQSRERNPRKSTGSGERVEKKKKKNSRGREQVKERENSGKSTGLREGARGIECG